MCVKKIIINKSKITLQYKEYSVLFNYSRRGVKRLIVGDFGSSDGILPSRILSLGEIDSRVLDDRLS